jgi:tetratricopeptide (TPR) repeat protein
MHAYNATRGVVTASFAVRVFSSQPRLAAASALSRCNFVVVGASSLGDKNSTTGSRTRVSGVCAVRTSSSSSVQNDSHPHSSSIPANPEGKKQEEPIIESKFPLPDRDKEKELARLQDHCQELHKAGQYRKALEAAELLERVTVAHYGKNKHPATASAHANVGLIHKLLGNFIESRRQYKKALAVYKETVGDDHASYATVLHNLGLLCYSQMHFDENLSMEDRLGLLEQAIDHLSTAYRIRLDERGPAHPHTVASRSSWGSCLATKILQQCNAAAAAAASTTTTGSSATATSVSDELTQAAWEAALEHLRQALQTAVQHPRGPSIAPPENASTGKKRKQQQQSRQKSKGSESTTKNKSGIQTLSAAAAGQNLAIYLKARATTNTSAAAATMEKQSVQNQTWLQEAYDLYRDVLAVRKQLLPADHPDLYATKYSLAELLQALGDTEAANVLRQEILDTIDPPNLEPPPPQPADGTVQQSQN